MASMKEVARLAGVSVATVSQVLRGTKRFTPEVEARVRAAARELGYLPDLRASALRTGRSDIVGVLLPDLSNPYFPALLNALEVAARAAGLLVLVHDSGNEVGLERHALERLASVRVDGLLWVPSDASVAGAKALPRRDLPVVTLDRPLPGRDAVYSDHAQGGRLLARHLLALGRRRVALLAGPAELPSARARRRGFLEAFEPLAPVFEGAAAFTHRLPEPVRRRLRQAVGGFDAVVCPNDAVAIGVVRVLREAGVRVPQDVCVTGFDDIPWAAMMEPPLTTVRQPLAAIGAEAVRLLLERIRAPEREPRQVMLPVELVERASTAPATAAPQEGSEPSP